MVDLATPKGDAVAVWICVALGLVALLGLAALAWITRGRGVKVAEVLVGPDGAPFRLTFVAKHHARHELGVYLIWEALEATDDDPKIPSIEVEVELHDAARARYRTSAAPLFAATLTSNFDGWGYGLSRDQRMVQVRETHELGHLPSLEGGAELELSGRVRRVGAGRYEPVRLFVRASRSSETGRLAALAATRVRR
jgi:hypothetical protein